MCVNMERKNDNKTGAIEFKPATNKPINICEYKILVNCKISNKTKNKIKDIKKKEDNKQENNNKEEDDTKEENDTKEDDNNKEEDNNKLDNLQSFEIVEEIKLEEDNNNNNKEEENIHCEFMVNAKIVDYIKIRHNDKEYKLTKVPYHGVKVSFNGYLGKPVVITVKPKDYCSKVNIWDLKQINEEYTDIKWDKIYVINLKRRPERKENMMMQFEELGFENYEFIEAVDGQDEDVKKEFEELKKNKKTDIVSEGHYGCLKSHIKVILKARKERIENVLILEDDIIIDKDFFDKIYNIKVPEYDMLYFGGVTKYLKMYYENISSATAVMGTYAYILNYKMYNRVVIGMKQKLMYADAYYAEEIQKKKDYKIYLLNDIVKTTIEDTDTSNKNKIVKKSLEYINCPEKYYENIV